MNYLERSVGNKKILWLKQYNRYLVLELSAYDVIKRKLEGQDRKIISAHISKSYHLPESEAKRYVGEIVTMIKQLSDYNIGDRGNSLNPSSVDIPNHFYSTKCYKINELTFHVQYGSYHLEHLNHQKFAHLESNLSNIPDHQFQVFQNGEQSVLLVNGKIIGQWLPENDHYLSGKFSMELLNAMYHRTESDWMGVFHASAISNKEKCMLFLGDSGSGKSTTCAVLMASGFNLLADDFVPVDGSTGSVYSFPAAVSVKKSAITSLIDFFPELEAADEFAYPEMDKTVRFLPPVLQSDNSSMGYPCKALVFVKYKEDSGMTIEKLPSDVAFPKLVPDSWISPIEENASRFLDWFLGISCYQLIYSDNDRMVNAIQKLFSDDL